MIRKIIRQFRVTSKYKGYLLIIDATQFYTDKDFVQITKDVYPALAQKYHTSTASVERNIRTVVEICWQNDRKAVQDIIGYDITRCPSNSEFLEAIAYSMSEHKK